MTMQSFSMRQLLEAGVHFGHQTRRWNPKMAPFLYGTHGGVHIIDLRQTVPMFHQALDAIKQVAANGGKVLFVGTKPQASDKVRETARLCGQYYMNHRWLGGTLTNWKTVTQSIRRLKELEEQLSGETHGFTKKELLTLTRERDKLERGLGGIKDMGGVPDILFVIDTNREEIAVKEANKLNIPVVAIIDSNSTPEGVDFPIPGNDDATRAIDLYCDLVAGAVLEGMKAEIAAKGVDMGALENVPAEVTEAPVEEEFSETASEEDAAAE